MDQSLSVALLLLVISPFVGTLLAMVADRMQASQDALLPRLGCPTCGAPVRWWQRLPVISYLILRGRCAQCNAVIPPALLVIEVLAIGATVIVALDGGTTLGILLNTIFLWLLITLAACDLRWFRLPDPLTAALALTVLGLAVIPGGIGLWDALAGAALCGALFWVMRRGDGPLRFFGTLGLGDVKLMVGLGGFAGARGLPMFLLIAAAIGLCVYGMWRLKEHRMRRGPRPPIFGAVLCAAAAVVWVITQ